MVATKTKRRIKTEKTRKKAPTSTTSLHDIEFHREAVCLVSDPESTEFTFGQLKRQGGMLGTSCSCRSNIASCRHVRRLVPLYEELCLALDGDPERALRASLWFKLLAGIAEDHSVPVSSVQLAIDGEELDTGLLIGGDTLPPGPLTVTDGDGQVLVTYLSHQPDRQRFCERLVELRRVDTRTRADHLAKLRRLTATTSERLMEAAGRQTIRQAMELSIWFRLAYHLFRELPVSAGGDQAFVCTPAVDPETAEVTLTIADGDRDRLQVHIPHQAVMRVCSALESCLPEQPGLPKHPEVIRQLIRMVSDPEDGSLELQRVIRVPVPGEQRFEIIPCESIARFFYGKLAYVPQLAALADLSPPGRIAASLGSAHRRRVERGAVPGFLEQYRDSLTAGADSSGEGEAFGLVVLDTFDRLQVDPHALDRDWCWISLHYGSGRFDLSLADLLRLRSEGQRFVKSPDGWVDTEAEAFEPLYAVAEQYSIDDVLDPQRGIKLSRMELLRLCSARLGSVVVSGDDERAQAMRRLLQLKPAEPLRPLQGMTSSLRAYQERGAQWLLFLVDNRFGGLLCDDMGLGKTHQVLALLLALVEQRRVRGPFMVVCPATVLSHWERIINVHAPGLEVKVYYEQGRDLEGCRGGTDVLLTTYGILRRDIELLAELDFTVAVFDEAQYVKNPSAIVHSAARRIAAGSKIALTGTPIENSLSDLKALFDLTLPGYLGSDAAFAKQFVTPIETTGNQYRRESLKRLVEPFTLRRLKISVLDELPPKIEDIRTCSLSEDQVKLYRDAIGRRSELLRMLRNTDEQIPYIHIFALLGMLKQICDHPALVAGTPEQYEDHQSGKWELFKELLRESMESEQKVVVYSQYLDMIRIIELHLEQLGIGSVTLTGASRKRGEIIERFNTDPDCRVFVGSLLAGGIGIDLVAASVVIHYDRWWNAAREDQATDRVHRIGQTRGVQVFKLVTEGTLEEKIAALITKKKTLMESIVKEDDKAALKTFSREELIELIELPR